jgi:drug/metabolite transporter (DMT)-like permease
MYCGQNLLPQKRLPLFLSHEILAVPKKTSTHFITMTPSDIVRLISLGALWGGSYSFMRAVAPVFGGIGTMWLRISIAGIVLLAYALVTREDLQWAKWWKQYLFIGVMNSAVPFGLIAFAMKTLPVSYGAILNTMSPFFAALFAAMMLDERLSAPRVLGMVLGFVGVAVIINLGPIPLNTETLTAAAACVAATCSYGFIIVYTKKYTKSAPTMGVAVGALILPALLVTPLGLMVIPHVVPTGNVLLSLLGLAVLCSSIAYLLYYRLIRDVGPTRAISVTFLIPVFGAVWGAIFFGETLNSGALIGGAIVLLGVALVLGVLPIQRQDAKR